MRRADVGGGVEERRLSRQVAGQKGRTPLICKGRRGVVSFV